MGCLSRRFAERERDDALSRLGAQWLDARGAGLIARQTAEPVLQKKFLPAPNAGLGLVGAPHDLVRADAIDGQQHDLGSPNVLLGHVPVLNEGLEPTNVVKRDGESFSCAHRADSHTEAETGILSGTQMLGAIH